MKKVLITGANGQLAKCIAHRSAHSGNMELIFMSREDLDIENEAAVSELFQKNRFTHCINTAAYTNVEKAESNKASAFGVNSEGAKNIANSCSHNGVILLHISTDYVFNGEKERPYTETDTTDPINVYGASKLKGEMHVRTHCKEHFIFRTSWLYSQYGHNFLNTILKYSAEKKPLTITTQQTGTPTNANDLADMLLTVISEDKREFGLYHYANEGKATWYDFARAILTHTGRIDDTILAKTDHYRTFAARPAFSVLDTSKLNRTLGIKTVDWNLSLQQLLKKI
jgi:dTDP-4-dehydrorhamnose reductase